MTKYMKTFPKDLESITQLCRLFFYPKFQEIIFLYIYSNNLV